MTRSRDVCVSLCERRAFDSDVDLTCMAATPAAKNSVHWAPSPILSPLSDSLSHSSSSSFTSSSSTIQYINSQLVSHGFGVPPGLSLEGLSTADAENVTKCLLSMLSQRVVSVAAKWVLALVYLFVTGGHDTRRGNVD